MVGKLESGKKNLMDPRKLCALDGTFNQRGKGSRKLRRGKQHIDGYRRKKKTKKHGSSSDSEVISQLVTVMAGEDVENVEKELRTKVHVKAEFIGFAIPIKFIVLMDSGASRDNYIASEFYYQHESEIQQFARYCKGFVLLGDGKTKAKIICVVNLPVMFQVEEVSRIVELRFVVYDALSTNQDAIIGLNSLLGDCYYIYLDILKAGRKSLLEDGIYNLSTEEYVEPFQTILEEKSNLIQSR